MFLSNRTAIGVQVLHFVLQSRKGYQLMIHTCETGSRSEENLFFLVRSSIKAFF